MGTEQSKYPKPKEILDPPVDFKKETIDAVIEWKLQYFMGGWKQKSKEEQVNALEQLILKLCGVYGEEVLVNKQGDSFYFVPSKNTIVIDKNNPSIISTLHEFKHKLSGESEKLACRWSVQLFKEVFPKSFAELRFKEGTHMLIKK